MSTRFLHVSGEPSSQSLVRRSIMTSTGELLALSDEEQVTRRRFHARAALLLGWALVGVVALVLFLAGKAHGSTLGDCVKGCTSAQDDCLALTHTTDEAKVCDAAAKCCRLLCEGKLCEKVTSCYSSCDRTWERTVSASPLRANLASDACEDRCPPRPVKVPPLPPAPGERVAGARGPGCGHPPEPPCQPSPPPPARCS